MNLPTVKWQFYIQRVRRSVQGRIGFYRAGVQNEQIWYGLTLPYIEIRFIKFLQWGNPQK